MKKQIFSLMLLAVLMMAVSTSCTKVPAGQVGVKVYLLGGEKGVSTEVLGVGRYHININEELYLFPTYQVNYVFTKDQNEGSPQNEEFTFQTKEGMECSMDLGVAMHFEQEHVSAMFQTYHKGENEIRGVVVRNTIRDALNKVSSNMPVEHVYGEGKTALIDSVKSMVRANLKATGIGIDNVYLIGSIRIPETVIKALNAKIEMTQKAQQSENQLRDAEAQAKIKVVNAEAEAKANQLISNSINQTLVQWEALKKWNGILPTVTSGAIPLINLK